MLKTNLILITGKRNFNSCSSNFQATSELKMKAYRLKMNTGLRLWDFLILTKNKKSQKLKVKEYPILNFFD